MTDTRNRAVVFVLLLLACAVLGWLVHGSSTHVYRERHDVRERRDTATAIARVPPRAIELHGTGIRHNRTHGSTHLLDTLIRSPSGHSYDTIHIAHILPEDSFFVQIGLSELTTPVAIPYLARDSVLTIVDTRSNTQPWYEVALTVIVAVLGGWLLGRIVG